MKLQVVHAVDDDGTGSLLFSFCYVSAMEVTRSYVKPNIYKETATSNKNRNNITKYHKYQTYCKKYCKKY